MSTKELHCRNNKRMLHVNKTVTLHKEQQKFTCQQKSYTAEITTESHMSTKELQCRNNKITSHVNKTVTLQK
jgi:hypothetical protein